MIASRYTYERLVQAVSDEERAGKHFSASVSGQLPAGERSERYLVEYQERTGGARRMARQREEILNAELGRLLIARHPQWSEENVHIDSTRAIRGRKGAKIDVLVENPGGQPVAVETKFRAGAVQLAPQVEERLGLVAERSGLAIEAGVSVVYPENLSSSELEESLLRYAIHELGEGGLVSRWPEHDDEWLGGDICDVADAIESLSVSGSRIREGGEILANGVLDASARLEEGRRMTGFGSGMAQVLHQAEGEQTTRMAVAIIVNAFVFHYAIEGQDGIPDPAAGRGPRGFSKSRVLQVWDSILAVNYWPIFRIAKDILEAVPARLAGSLLTKADGVAEDLVELGAATLHDLAARMFQTLIADRKFLATFYTLPESASLLAECAVGRLHADWGDAEAVKALRIADFACGTGTLLSAAQRAVYRRFRRAGGDDVAIHRDIIERVLVGTDIMPSAAHLAASMLSSAHPGIGYGQSLVRSLPYGEDRALSELRGKPAGTAYIGALDLLRDELGQSLFTANGLGHGLDLGGRRMAATGAEAGMDAGGREFPVEHESFDLVIMNPPFTRPTNHEGAKSDVPVPSFAGFERSAAEQRAMSKSLKAQSGMFGHGNAGLASNFMDLAHAKLKPGGVVALVLPFAFVSGESWSNARSALSSKYVDVQIVSVAAHGNTTRAFSADTGMAECLLVAEKRGNAGCGRAAVRYVNLRRRPQSHLEAQEAAKRIRAGGGIKGTLSDAGAAGVLDPEVARVMMEFSRGRLELPRVAGVHRVAVARLGKLAERGVVDRDINGTGGRGPFDIESWDGLGAPAYPALWKHHAGAAGGNQESRLVVRPDTLGKPRAGCRDRAAALWQSIASRLHCNRDFRLNSQSLGMCLTEEPSIGGRAWPNVLPYAEEHGMALLLWGNSTLGLMQFWWQGARQQQGRVIFTISRIPDLVTLDAAALDGRQLAECGRIFERMRERVFLPANEAYRDDARKELDAALFAMLGLPGELLAALDVVRLKWCCEPSVHGGKATKPESA